MTISNKPRRMAREPITDNEVPSIQGGAEAEAEVAGRAETAKRPTKTSLVVGMLRQADGASVGELIAATGWQAHTTRAALTGLRKQGHFIERVSLDGVTRYRIVAAAGE